MKKKIALLLAAVMTVCSLPMTAFAKTDNNIGKISTVEVDDKFSATITMDEFDGVDPSDDWQTVKMTLNGAKLDGATPVSATYVPVGGGAVTADTIADGVNFQQVDDYTFQISFHAAVVDSYSVKIMCEAKEEGDATLTVDGSDSVVTSGTYKIANVVDGATVATISGKESIKETATKIKTIAIEETTAGAIEFKAAGTASIKLKLTNGFEWCDDGLADGAAGATKLSIFPSGSGVTAGVATTGGTVPTAGFEIDKNDAQVAYINLAGPSTGSTKALTISLANAYVKYTDDAEVGDECEVTISEADVTKTSLVVGTATDYAVTMKVEDKELPTFWAGRGTDKETLKVTIKEGIAGSWIGNRKAKIVFPDGVEVLKVNETKDKNFTAATYAIDENEVSISGTPAGGAAELGLKFELSVAPDFTGDITATLTGSAVGEDQTVTVGTAAFPVTVEADVNELKIDYRNTTASDIVITEAAAGVLGKDRKVTLELDEIKFDGDPTVEVESGDMKIKDVKVAGGTIQFTVKTESQKEAAVIRISDVELYMQRSLPAGEYDLSIVTAGTTAGTNMAVNGTPVGTTAGADVTSTYKDATAEAVIRNHNTTDDDGTFDCDSVTVKAGYVTIVTAGREQDDSTFTTKVTVSIGADKMLAGTKEIALDVPAYIANGYTMLPVRAVTEALSGAAIVRWDDATKTVTITFGQRVINMTVGSRTMVINGVNVAMQAACEITDSRAFIPLRDLGYALGLNDSKIAWDDATKTATLN